MQFSHDETKDSHFFDQEFRSRWKAEKYEKDDHYARYARLLEDGGHNHRCYLYKAQYENLLHHPGKKVLDCACGAGRFSIWLALNGKEVYAFDSSRVAIEIAKESAELSGVSDRVQFDHMDVCDLKYEDNFFDMITGEECLHHLIEWPEGLKQIARVLKPGGKGYFHEPLAFNPFVNLLRAIRIRMKKQEGEHFLARDDIDVIKNIFGEIRLHDYVGISFLTRFIANRHTTVPLNRAQRRICILLNKIDRMMETKMPVIEKYASNACIEITKTIEENN